MQGISRVTGGQVEPSDLEQFEELMGSTPVDGAMLGNEVDNGWDQERRDKRRPVFDQGPPPDGRDVRTHVRKWLSDLSEAIAQAKLQDALSAVGHVLEELAPESAFFEWLDDGTQLSQGPRLERFALLERMRTVQQELRGFAALVEAQHVDQVIDERTLLLSLCKEFVGHMEHGDLSSALGSVLSMAYRVHKFLAHGPAGSSLDEANAESTLLEAGSHASEAAEHDALRGLSVSSQRFS